MKTILRSLLIKICLLISVSVFAIGNKIPSSPLSFLKNKGQWNNDILFKGVTTTTSVYFLNNGVSFAQAGEEIEIGDSIELHPYLVWNMKFVNENRAMKISSVNERKSKVSFLSGNDSTKWIIHPEECSQINYNKIYKNIDLTFYGKNNNLKYDYIVHPGGNINSIRSYYEGVKNLSINADGELEIETKWNIQKQNAPVAWQVIKGKQHPIEIKYVIINDTTFGFKAEGGYNKNYDLIIDPLFEMVWSSYTNIPGGNNNINYCFSNAMDEDGNVYLTGMVDGTFPITPGAYSGPGNVEPEIFVAKFASDGTTLIYWTYLPGNSSEHGTGIAVDNLGRAYVTGVVDLNFTGLTNFPSTANAYQPVHNSGSDAFLSVLNPTGTGFVYSSFLGGTGSESGYEIALGPPGIAYITGSTSTGNFPVVASAVFPTGNNDVFLAKFDINQSGNNSLIYSTRIGGGSFSDCHGRSIAVNSAGNAFITGTIGSGFGTPVYPTTPGAYNTVYNTGQDGVMSFVTKLSAATPVTLDYSTLLAPGTASAIAVDASTDDAFIVGTTYTFAFPITVGALQPTHAGAGGTDAFAVRLNSTGSTLVYSTFLGGNTYETGTGVAVNSIGEAYVVGIAQDLFPTSAGAYQPNNAGTYDFFVVNLNTTGTAYGFGGSTYVGGSDADYSGSFYDYASPHVSIRDHGGNNDTICVSSTSHSIDFPTTAGVYGPVKVNGISDQPVFFKMTCAGLGAVPSVNISSTDSTWCDKKAVDFFDLSTNNPTSWQWYFPGAVPDTSTLQNPTGIYYPTNGVFAVTLVACNNVGCDSVTYSTFINELPTPVAPVVTINADTLCAPIALGYQWFEVLNPSVILSTAQCFVPLVAGNYFALVTDTNGCQSALQTIPITTSLLENNSFESISVIPNPFSASATLELNLSETKNISISIVDVIGREVKNISAENLDTGYNKIEIDLSEIKAGIYFLRIVSSHNHSVIKCMKKN
jgi:hypothetical protein